MKRTLMLLAGALCYFLSVPVSAQRLGVELEHFKCYPVTDQDPVVSDRVWLSDQFNVDPDGKPFEELVKVADALRFCNPVEKRHRDAVSEIGDEDHHLTLYATYPQAQPHRVALVLNQFGLQVLRLRDAIALAVPTHKRVEDHQAPEGLDHFRCYAASGRQTRDIVGLRDQFDRSGHRVIEPVAFCNPVRKRHEDKADLIAEQLVDPGDGTEIQHPDAHLTCYAMTRVRFEQKIGISNQFVKEGTLVVGPPDTLCVPTFKFFWRELPDLDLTVGAAVEDE